MLTKLLKYDLKFMIKRMIVFYLLAFFFSILSRLFSSLGSTVMLHILTNISYGCMFSMLANILINTMMISWIRFRDSIYKDEAYLTHTLPVTKKDIYNSKFIQTLIFYIIGFIIIVLCLFVAFYTKENWLIVKGMINKITTGLEFNTTLFITSMLTVIFLEIFNAIQCGFLGIILGYRKSNGKAGCSVLVGFIAYLLAQSIVLFLVFITGVFNSNIMDLFKNNIMLNSSSFKLLVLISIIIYVIIITLMSILCKKELNKGVDIE